MVLGGRFVDLNMCYGLWFSFGLVLTLLMFSQGVGPGVWGSMLLGLGV